MLHRDSSVLVVIDVQESYRNLTFDHAGMQRGVEALLGAATIFGIPVVATEQYPKGLGHLIPEVTALLPPNTPVLEKMTMSCCGQPEFVASLRAIGRSQVVVCGIEAHACVNQTVHELIDSGYQVHLPADAISSRFERDYHVAMQKMLGSGAVPATVEMVCLEWVRSAAIPEFKQIHRLIK